MILDVGYKAKQDKRKQDGTGLKILTPKQMLERLTIALAQVKAGNNSESLLNFLLFFSIKRNHKKSIQ